jgi:hypothetical protein
VARAAYVRGYLPKDGRLNLSLMADVGIYVWESMAREEPYETKPDAKLEMAILKTIPSYTRDVVDLQGETGKGRYIYGLVDRNGDGGKEAFVYLLGSKFCGTGGCDLLLLTPNQDNYSLVNRFPISRLPTIVSSHKSNGWNDLVRPESGGGIPPSYVLHTFNGKKYLEKKRMRADKKPEETRYLEGEIEFKNAIILEPRR